jgi:trimeric autotransporter adhesin
MTNKSVKPAFNKKNFILCVFFKNYWKNNGAVTLYYKITFQRKIMKKFIRIIKTMAAGLLLVNLLTACPPNPNGTPPFLGLLALFGGGSSTPAATYSLGGEISGMAAGQTVQLTNGSSTLDVAANGVFTFPEKLANNTSYNVQVGTVPAGLACTAGNNVGTIAGADISNISVVCGIPHTLSVQVTDVDTNGSLGSGLTFQANGQNDTAVNAFSTPTAFSVQIVEGAKYTVSVKTQPSAPNQVCSPLTATDGTGTMPASAKTVTFGCSTNHHTVSVNVTGLAGSGLILENNLDNVHQLTPAVPGTFAFTPTVVGGLPYSVTIKQQPTNLSQNCTLGANSSGTATADVTVNVTCVTNSFTVGGAAGSVTGLASGESVILRINGGSNKTVTFPADSFSFSIPDGTAYTVSVYTKPATKSCSVTNATGTLAGANVTNVTVSCVSCLAGSGTKSATVTWDASRSYDVKTAAGGGHKIYYTTNSTVSVSDASVDVPKTTSTTSGIIPNLYSGCTYNLKVGAYSTINPDSTGITLSALKSITVN